ncbi:hypothetical protein EDD85DRAFT_790455 [Armillaria nabsnona]|nr:hypothetical protein EDD85DRAFT_790455 [Armillaria nabsnona]
MDHGIPPFSLPSTFYLFFLTLNRFPSGVHRFHCKGRKDVIGHLSHPSTVEITRNPSVSSSATHPESYAPIASVYFTFTGLWPVVGYDVEREIGPMCIDEGLAIAPWGSVGQGRFKMKEEVEERKLKNEFIRSYTADSA